MRRILKAAGRLLSFDYPRIPPIAGDGRPSDAVGAKAWLDALDLDLSRLGEPITCEIVLNRSPNFFLTNQSPTLFVFPNYLYLTTKQLPVPSTKIQFPSIARDHLIAKSEIDAIIVRRNRHEFDICMKPRGEIRASTVTGTSRFQSLNMASYLPTWLATKPEAP